MNSHFFEQLDQINQNASDIDEEADVFPGVVSGQGDSPNYSPEESPSYSPQSPLYPDESLQTANAQGTTGSPYMQQVYKAQRNLYEEGLEKLDSLQLVDLSPLANWKLSLFKPGYGVAQLRDDSPDTYWQSDGLGNQSNNNSNNNNSSTNLNQLANPHSITIQFLKKVSLERISIFANYSLDESYTPSKIQVMAGSSETFDLTEVCVVDFVNPNGWSHIIFNGIRSDGVLKCFVVKVNILSNHQDGKDSHVRAIRCFGRKQGHLTDTRGGIHLSPLLTSSDIIATDAPTTEAIEVEPEERIEDGELQQEFSKTVENVLEVIGFNSGFQSLSLKSFSSIR